jgi:hypothetical protein
LHGSLAAAARDKILDFSDEKNVGRVKDDALDVR